MDDTISREYLVQVKAKDRAGTWVEVGELLVLPGELPDAAVAREVRRSIRHAEATWPEAHAA